MEKKAGTYTITFKEELNMLDRQRLLRIQKNFIEKKDEMQLCFDMFVVLCTKVNGAFCTEEEARNWIQELTDVSAFNEIATIMTEIQTKSVEVLEKKKTDENINSVNEPKLAE